MVDWELWHSARELALAGSYKIAAANLGVNPTTVKRRVDALERIVGRSLFVKFEGQIVPTPVFRSTLKNLHTVSEALETAKLDLSPNVDQSLWRRCIITSVPYICDRLLCPSIDLLPPIKRFRLEIVGGNENMDLIGGLGADFALRLGPARNQGNVAHHIADVHYSTYAIGDVNPEDLPWVTGDRSLSNLKEVRLPEENPGKHGIRYTGTSMVGMASMISSGMAKGILPDFIGKQIDGLQRCNDHPSLLRPLWIMWKENAVNEPHFRTVLSWILQLASESLTPTSDLEKITVEMGISV